MDENKKTQDTQESTEEASAGADTGPREHAGTARDRKEFEERLDHFADRLSGAMSDGVRRLEEAFDKGKQNVREDRNSKGRFSGSPRMGMILVGLGIVWLLYSLGVLRQPIFPILLIVLGVYFLLRDRGDRGDESGGQR
jgi:hypothetical protein